MKILITGGAGFIASHIADIYIKNGHNVVIVDDLSSGRMEYVNKHAKFYKADIRDKKEIEKIFRIEKPQILNHHAAQISVRNSVEDPILDSAINITGLLNLLETGIKNDLQKVIFASSGGVVYGDAKIIPTPENFVPKHPLSPYGVSKLTSELYLNYYYKSYGLSYVALRYSNVFGPRQNPHGEAGVVAIFTLKLLKNIVPTINGDGLQTRDYVYVGDVANANLKALNTKIVGEFNIGTGIETDVNGIYKGINDVLKTKINPKYGPAKQGEQKRSCVDNKLAKITLGWKPETTLQNGLINTIEFFQENAK